MLALYSAGVLAAPPTARERDLSALRVRIQALRRELDAKESLRKGAVGALRKAEQAISNANRAVHSLDAREHDVQAQLRSIATQRHAAEQALAQRQHILDRLLVAREMHPVPDVLRLVLSGKNPADISRQLYYLAQAARAVAQLIDSVRSQLAELARLQRDAAQQARRLTAIVAQRRTERAKLIAEHSARQRALKRLSRQILDQHQRIQAMLADEHRLTHVVRAIGRVLSPKHGGGYARVELIPQADQTEEPFPDLRGKLRLPVRGELIDHYGAPRPGGGPRFKGVFIRAPQGAPVRAIAAGTVVFADWMRGFGNLLIVDHGDGYMSIYADNETLLKQTGARVTSGEVIATVGSTGGNQQSGLYFELRHLGKAVDPLRWVKLK